MESLANAEKKRAMSMLVARRGTVTGLTSTTVKGESSMNVLIPSGSQLQRANSVSGSMAQRDRKFVPGDPSNTSRPLPLQYVISNIEKRVHSSLLYSDMLIYWPFLIMFLFFFFNGRDIEVNHMAASGSRAMYMVHSFWSEETSRDSVLQQLADNPNKIPELPANKVYRTIGRADDWHNYFRDVFIPNTWDCENPGYSRSTLVKRGQMQFLGALRLRVMAMSNSSCAMNPAYISDDTPPEKKLCFSVHKGSREAKETVCDVVNPGNLNEKLWVHFDKDEVEGGVMTTGTNGYYHAGGYIATIPFNSTCTQVLEMARLIRQGPCAIIDDRQTRFVTLEWFQYNTNTDTFLTAKFFYEVTSAGAWVPNYQLRMFPVWTPKRLLMSIYDIFFFVFVLYFLFRLIFDWISFYRREKRVLAFCFDLWNLLEVTNIASFLAVFILRWIWWTRSQKSKIEFPWAAEYPKDLDRLVLLFSAQIYANAVNVVITVLKVLKFLRLNNRLNVLTRTMYVCQQSIIGVLVLFVFVVTGYALSGTSLYGSNLFGFRNVNTSFSSLMFMLLGQFDYAGMRKQQPLLAGLYFFSFMILAQFLLLNFIIAILSDGFAQVSHDTSLEPLDKVILRQLWLLQFTLHPKNIKKVLELRLRRKTRTDLLHEMGKYLQEHMDLIEIHSPDLLDNDLPMSKDDLKHWLPEHLHQDLGDYYIDLLWDDMEHDHGIDILSDDYIKRKEIETIVVKGTHAALGSKLTHIQHLEPTMCNIEDKIALITGNQQRF